MVLTVGRAGEVSLASKASCHSAHSRMPPTAGMGEPQWWTALLPGSGSWHRAVGVSRLYRCSRASERMGLQCSISSPDQTPQSVPTEGASASSEGARGTVHIYTICIYVRVRVRACMIMPARLQRWCRRGDRRSSTSRLYCCHRCRRIRVREPVVHEVHSRRRQKLLGAKRLWISQYRSVC